MLAPSGFEWQGLHFFLSGYTSVTLLFKPLKRTPHQGLRGKGYTSTQKNPIPYIIFYSPPLYIFTLFHILYNIYYLLRSYLYKIKKEV